MIDEKSLRKPGFDEANSVPVVFANGQTFFVPKPFVRCLRPTFKNKKADATRVITDDPEFDALFKVVDETDTFVSMGNLAAFMLSKHYELSDDDLGELLEFVRNDTNPDRWSMKVMAVAYGYDSPKP